MTNDVVRVKDVFNEDEWDRIAMQVVEFKKTLLYRAMCARIKERRDLANKRMLSMFEPNHLFQQQGRVLAHNDDIMVIEDLHEIARKPRHKRT